MTTEANTIAARKITADGTFFLYPGIGISRGSRFGDEDNTGAYGIYGAGFLKSVDRMLADLPGILDAEMTDSNRGFFVKCNGTIELPEDSEAYKLSQALQSAEAADPKDEAGTRGKAVHELGLSVAQVMREHASRSGFTVRAEFRSASI